MPFNSPPDNTELQERMEILSALPLHPLDKAELALIALGEKPATSIFYSYSLNEEGRLTSIEQKIADVGLSVDHGRERILGENDAIPLETNSSGTVVEQNRRRTIYIAGCQKDMTELRELGEKYFYPDTPLQISDEDHRKFGRLYGFPETAINAFISREKLLRQDLPEDIRSQDHAFFLSFAFSKDNWSQEIETGKRWYNALNEHAPTILKEYVDGMKALRAEQARRFPRNWIRQS